MNRLKKMIRLTAVSFLLFGGLLFSRHALASDLPTARIPDREMIELFEMTTIPVVYVHIDGGEEAVDAMNESSDHSVTCTGSVDIEIPDGYTCAYTDVLPEGYLDLAVEYIRGRGNSTWGIDKKPYKFKLEKKADLFGMGENKHWVLLADRFDNSHLRNRLSLWLADRLGMEYTSRCIPVDLVMEGTYYGHYLLCEQVRVDQNRVEIDELKESDTDPETVTGGYLLALNPYVSDPKEDRFYTDRYISFGHESPKFDPDEGYENDAQRDYIRGYIQKTEDAIFGEDFCDEDGVSWREYLDEASLADYWWIEMLTSNEDAFRTPSTYLYKKRGGKLYFGPVWDFDNSFGNASAGEERRAYFIYDETPWIDRLREDPSFCELLKERWTDVKALAEKITEPGGILDTFAGEISGSWALDRAKWGAYTGNGLKDLWLDEEKEIIRSWLNARVAWIDEHLDDVGKTTCTITFEAGEETVGTLDFRVGNTVNRMLSAPEKEGYIFEGWKCGNGEYLRLFRPVYEDMTVTASYLAEKGDALTGSIKETEGAADPGSTALAETFVDSESTAVMPDQEAGESVKKEKPFWKRPWFYGALAAAAAFIAAFFIIRGKDRKENWFDEFRDGRG